MTQEEKLKEAKRLYETANADKRYVLEKLFPELKESEDERIRKELLEHCKNQAEPYIQTGNECPQIQSWIAWLEKQGEHANFRNKIQIGDKVTRNRDGVLVNLSQLNRVAKVDERQGKTSHILSNSSNIGKDEQKSTDKKEHKFKVGDEIKAANEESLTVTKIDKKGYWSEDLFICGFDDADKWELVEQKPANTDFSDLRIWKYIVDAAWTEKEGIGQYLDSPFTEEVAKKLQKRFGNIEQKPTEWSEEDERIFKSLQTLLNDTSCYLCTEGVDKILSWLKSIRPQNRWKPSDLQMEALDSATENCAYSEYQDCLRELLEQLKKLKEE